MYRTINIDTIGTTAVCKAMSKIASDFKKSRQGKNCPIMTYIHYNSQKKWLEATNGKTAMTLQVTNFPEENTEGLFELQGKYLIEVNEQYGKYPDIQRVMPDTATDSDFMIAYKIFNSSTSDFHIPTYVYLNTLVGNLGYRINCNYLSWLSDDILEQAPLVGVYYTEDKHINPNKPILITDNDRTFNYLVMPMKQETFDKLYLPDEQQTDRQLLPAMCETSVRIIGQPF